MAQRPSGSFKEEGSRAHRQLEHHLGTQSFYNEHTDCERAFALAIRFQEALAGAEATLRAALDCVNSTSTLAAPIRSAERDAFDAIATHKPSFVRVDDWCGTAPVVSSGSVAPPPGPEAPSIESPCSTPTTAANASETTATPTTQNSTPLGSLPSIDLGARCPSRPSSDGGSDSAAPRPQPPHSPPARHRTGHLHYLRSHLELQAAVEVLSRR